jgi:hypothetical protein
VNEQAAQEYVSLPIPESQRLIDFEQAEVLTLESFPPQYLLAVSGTKPYLNMDVRLMPRVYIRQPEYWGIEVVGSLPGGIGLPALAPYSVSVRLNGTMGTRGIEVIGATRTETIELPPPDDTGPRPNGLPPRELFRHWRHSHEEDTQEAEVYRPAAFDFPPAFGRLGFEIRPNGEFVAHEIGPADEPLELPGRWTAADADRIGVCVEGRDPYTLTILSVDAELLRIRRR